MSPEPFGHRGHPTSGEMFRARGTAMRVGATVAILGEHGFSHVEAMAFISGVCLEVARDRGESWSDLSGNSGRSALRTVEGILLGHGAKHWALDVIDIAMGTIHDLLESS